MAQQQKPQSGQPDIIEEMRRRNLPTPDAPAIVPHPGEEAAPGDSRPPEDGGVAQHPVHDSDVEDLGPEDYEEMADEVQKTGIRDEP